MRQEPCKVHGYLTPADEAVRATVDAVLIDWSLPPCTDLEGEILRLDFEGVFFPLDDVLAGLANLSLSGKIDVIDMEAWTLTRALFTDGAVRVSTVGLNHVLAYSGH